MRYASLGFHVIMLALLVLAFTGAFAPAPTGNFAHDNGSYIPSVIGIFVIWVIGSILFRVLRKFSNY